MNATNLTMARADAICPPQTGRGKAMKRLVKPVSVGMMTVLAGAISGCINVAAPDEPIVIELNINIRQEVIYRLTEDAADTIEENADIF